MTPRQKQIICESFPLIREIAIPVSLLFYGRLFDLDPSLRRLFKIDLKEQSKKLVATLDALVEGVDDWEKIVPVLRELGQRHVGYGVKEQHYDTVCSALVWAFGQALQPGFDDEVRAAWTAVIRAVNEQMKIGAAAVPATEQ
ncbi:MAG: globin domain-containing protein [Candidatus Acidiferrum sp.]